MSAPLKITEPLEPRDAPSKPFEPQPQGNGSGNVSDVCEAQVLHRSFAAKALQFPANIAVVVEHKEFTYQELNQQANQLAHHLLRLGAGPESLVALCVERSFEMLVGILSILKAGAAYVPIDPHYPAERVQFLLSDAGVKLVITQEAFASSLTKSRATILCLDKHRGEIAAESTQNPATSTLPESAAYVIYTSGSTGTPKGVIVTHANVTRLFSRTRDWFNFSPHDVWTLFHSFAFDFSVWEMWGALLHGGKLVIVPYFVSRTPEDFYDLLIREQVTVLNQTPSAFRQLIKAEAARQQPSKPALRLVILGGEALQLESLRPWIGRYGDQHPQLVNMFGITETTVHVTYRRVFVEDLEKQRGSVIGCPIPDLQVHVCDESLRPLSAGEPGELYVGGAGLARGYLNRPDLTAERFIPDPFSPVPGARLYRTGDLARRIASDDMEYLGRADQQVKVRGFRIELGEIENALARHAAVRENAVVADADEDGGIRLLAYAVFNGEPSAAEELRQFLSDKLPDYMVPSAIIPVAKLPLTAHGKLDRNALPSPTANGSNADLAPPRTSIEATLAEVWMDSLGLNSVGIDDNYFALGGDSIRSIKVRAKALERGLSFSLQQLFQNPTIRGLAAAMSSSEAQSDSHAPHAPFSMIADEDRHKLPPDAEDAYPISPLQAGMIFHSEFSPDYIVYVSSLNLRAHFDAEKMQQAIDHLAARHEMLRTSFDRTRFSIPLQIVHSRVQLQLLVEDLQHLPEAEQQQRIDLWLLNESRRKFDWGCAPLFRFTIHLRAQDRIQFTMSEPFLDGWSVASLLTELLDSYIALLGGGMIAGGKLTSSYRDFVALEQEALQSEGCRTYWKRMLGSGIATRLPYRRSGALSVEREVARRHVPLSEEISKRLKDVALSAGVSLKSVLLAAHMKVIATLSGHSEAFTGMLINGRPESRDGDKLIGAFLNTAPFRMRLQAGEHWIELARKAQKLENEMLPFRRYSIQEMQRLYGAENRFDTIFNFTHFHVMSRLQTISGMEVLDTKGSEQTYYALTAQFSINEFSSCIELDLDYRTIDLSEEQQVKEIAGYYSRVLCTMAADPLEAHDKHCFLPEEELHHLLAEPGQTRAPVSENACIHQKFAARAREFPDAHAVVFGDELLSYAELDRRANQLARYLQKAHVGPETLIGICLERGIGMIVGLLGILKTGAAYVPLDPDYPSKRLAFMIADAGLNLILTQEHLLARIGEHRARFIALDKAWSEIARESSAEVESLASPGNLAYVIYTSGSTGKPKGVLIEHRAVLNTIDASIRRFAVQQGSRVAQLASLCFDASVLEIFTALLGGGTLYIASHETLLSGQDLGRFLLQNAITTMAIPPSLLDLVPAGEYPALRSIVVGGEACGADTAGRWSEGRQLFNAYAPTEATIYATTMLCDQQQRQAPPIGAPIQNVCVYLLDEYCQPVPKGVAGELYIGGVGVARGYLNRPALTAERFIPDPFSVEPGTRLYRTGDLARVLQDGNIQFLGRTDQQVKIRGFRIELGDIEAALSSHPGLREAAVVAREDAPGEKRIVAYFVPHEYPAPTSSDLRAHLKRRIPDYMLPSAFIAVESMPLTDTGKIDRASFPAPERIRPELSQDYAAPKSALEKLVAGIFSEVLKLERVGTWDSFFELGGHSLIATQVVSRIRQLLVVELPLKAIFEEPTVSGLAAAILRHETEPARIEATAELILSVSELSEEDASLMLYRATDHESAGGAQ